ncbi:MAG TPA: AtzH-like domain-containing protein [Pyrinomonadaceae bacterium]|nr:AtzH-like domain-containing protein [Pyrinomonadaceae bacterium]
MLKRIAIGTALLFVTSAPTMFAQNTNSSTTRPRTASQPNTNRSSSETESTQETPAATPKPSPKSTAVTPKPSPKSTAAKPTPASTTGVTPGSQSVVAAFDSLLDGIRKADVKMVSDVYWNSPRLILFNNNGSVTKGWEQMRRNRESSYKDVKDVKLTTRDVSITMVGRDAAVVTCLWTQSQNFRGEDETATGRMTLVFRRVGKDWKAMHLHTSPDRPDPTRLAPSDKPTPTTPNP